MLLNQYWQRALLQYVKLIWLELLPLVDLTTVRVPFLLSVLEEKLTSPPSAIEGRWSPASAHTFLLSWQISYVYTYPSSPTGITAHKLTEILWNERKFTWNPESFIFDVITSIKSMESMDCMSEKVPRYLTAFRITLCDFFGIHTYII